MSELHHMGLAALAAGLRARRFSSVELAEAFLGRIERSQGALNAFITITREQALIAFTRTAAYSVFAEDRLGTLEAGKLADLAVLSQDIFKVPDADLPKTESVLTIVGGKIAYAQNGFK